MEDCEQEHLENKPQHIRKMLIGLRNLLLIVKSMKKTFITELHLQTYF